jgi:REG-2-like HAD superfamily hydrolase
MSRPFDLITFDCAETLLAVHWKPAAFAIECAQECGIELDAQVAEETYLRMMGSRWSEYQQINATGNVEDCLLWWRQLSHDWLARLGQPTDAIDDIMRRSDEMLYDSQRGYFRPFEDVHPTLTELRARNYRLAVISNWDYSLPRMLSTYRLDGYFEIVTPSLVFGVEKPDARIFHHTLALAGVEPARALHIGDDPLDDLQGARNAGLSAFLIDRSASKSEGHTLATLADLLPLLP